VVPPDRDVRPFQDVLLDLGARLGLPGMADDDGTPCYPGGYRDYLVNHERKPGIGPLAGWRGADGSEIGKGAANPGQIDAYIANGCFWQGEIPAEARFFKNVNQGYLDYAVGMGFTDSTDPIVAQLYCEPLQRFRLAARGHGPVQPSDTQRDRIETHFDPLPFWSPPLEDLLDGAEDYPLHAVTQRPMAMYHSWGSQNAWLRQLHSRNVLFVPRAWAEGQGIADGDWVWVSSRNGRIRVKAKLSDGVNGDTVWTWNAMGKRAGAWNLAPDAPEAHQAFLLNNLIDDLLPEREGGYRYSNSDPVTGQAAWYDLRVKIEKAPASEAGEIAPVMPAVKRPPGIAPAPAELRYGEGFRAKRRALPACPSAHRPRSSAWSSTSTPASAATPAWSTARSGTPAVIPRR
jgi:anaerobic selenocysteine-containing dehydrogenase